MRNITARSVEAGGILSIVNTFKFKYTTLLNLLGVIFVAILLVSWYYDNLAARPNVRAQAGELDLTSWDFAADGIVPLDGEWEFYWHQQIMPQNLANYEKSGIFTVPKKWEKYILNGNGLSGDGYATYHLRIKLGEHHGHLALKLSQIDTAYNLWVNGQLVSFVGIAGTDAYETKPQYLPQVVNLAPELTEYDLVLQVSNYDAPSGGIRESIQLGDSRMVHKAHELKMASELCLFGILLVMATYHFGLYRLRTNDKSAWYFGLFCFVIAIRVVTTGEILVAQIWPRIDWFLLLKADHIFSYLASLVFIKFIYYLYAEGQSKLFIRTVQIVILILIGTVLLTPMKVYAVTLTVYYGVNVICMIYISYVILRAIIARRHGAAIFACGSLIFLITVLNDMLATEGWVDSGYWLPMGTFIFMFFQSMLMSTRFAEAYTNLETISQELARSNQKINHILNSINEGFFTVDSQLQFTYVNKKIEEVWRRPAADILGRLVWKEVNDQVFYNQLLEAVRQNRELHFEFFSTDFDRWVEVNAYPFGMGLSVFIRDIQERKLAAAQLKEYAEELREQLRLLDLDPEYTLGLDLEGKITFWNQGAERGYGWSKEEALGKESAVLLKTKCPVPLPKIMEELMANGRWIGELTQTKKDGTEIIVRSCLLLRKNMNGQPESVREINNDITEQRNMEREMARLAQLNLIGQMAAGISHEVRNPMATVRGFLQLLLRKPECAKYEEYFKLMIDELDRANGIITEFLSVAKPKNNESSLQNINNILIALQPLLYADALKSGHMIEYHLETVPELILNGNEIRQMILNLARNGMEAMVQGGVLTVSTFVEGDSVVLAVRDQGKGIDPSVLAKIGTPFLTTKDCGTGLGLAVCYGIAARHKATVDVETGTGGTTFSIHFKLGEA